MAAPGIARNWQKPNCVPADVSEHAAAKGREMLRWEWLGRKKISRRSNNEESLEAFRIVWEEQRETRERAGGRSRREHERATDEEMDLDRCDQRRRRIRPCSSAWK